MLPYPVTSSNRKGWGLEMGSMIHIVCVWYHGKYVRIMIIYCDFLKERVRKENCGNQCMNLDQRWFKFMHWFP
jgi:hypothetical protein